MDLWVSDQELKERILNLKMWINQGRDFPNNYTNIQTISQVSMGLIADLVSDRVIMFKEIKRLETELSKKGG